MTESPTVYGLVAEFHAPDELVSAARRAREAGYTKMGAYTPFPVEELTEAMALRPTRLPLLVLLGGIAGCVGGYFMQYYAAVISDPMDVGGRPLNSWPSFVPVTFELTILAAALTAVLGMLALNGLPQPNHPLFNVPEFDRATQDRFFLCLQAADPQFDAQKTRDFLLSLNPLSVSEVPY
jgi:hypothetical protein